MFEKLGTGSKERILGIISL